MRSLTGFVCSALLVGVVLETAAMAQPEVRDHRAEPPTTTTAPQPAVDAGIRYRRRPGPRFMFPLKIDIGAAGVHTVRGYASGVGAAVGIHWASLSPTPTNFDVGIGLFGELLGTPRDPAMMTDGGGVALGGAYLEVAHTLASGSFWRTWASGRGEYLGSTAFDEGHVGFGGTGRVSIELFASGVGVEPRGLFLGTYALWFYVEAGARDVSPALGAFHAGAGLTIRTPFVFAP